MLTPAAVVSEYIARNSESLVSCMLVKLVCGTDKGEQLKVKVTQVKELGREVRRESVNAVLHLPTLPYVVVVFFCFCSIT